METMYGLHHPERGTLMILFLHKAMAEAYRIVFSHEDASIPVEYQPDNFLHRCAAAAGDAWVAFLVNSTITDAPRKPLDRGI